MKIDQTTNRIFFQKGFSLVELSIVLVILGLLTGGILTGQSLIRAAELRAITTEVAQYQTAVNTFQQKYFALPGDMLNAESFWSAASTDNGDGDGTIENGATPNTASEMFMFWNHLALAGLIQGQYTGIAGTSSIWDCLYNQNIPQSKIANTGYMLMTANYTAGDSWLFAYNYVNTIVYGGRNAGMGWTGDIALTPEEAWNIDTKMDDGRPAYGNVHAMNWGSGCIQDNGSLASTNFEVNYNLSNTSKQCSFVFRDLF